MRFLLLTGLFCLALLWGCRKVEVFTDDPSAKLNFSADIVLFDTVFTTVGSTTRRLKVYNPNENAVRISEIKLAGANASAYHININGQPLNQVKDVALSGKDSLTIFVKVTINPTLNPLPFIVTDSITFITNGNRQHVQLAAYGQNAHFLNGETISQNTIWDNKIPYIIYNSMLVDENVKLTVQKGTRVYFHKNSKLLIAGTLDAQGTKMDSITFASDRLERIYRDEPGQWAGLHFLGSSKDNRINYAIVKNALVGIRVDSLAVNNAPKLLLTNSVVKNMQVTGLAAFMANVTAFNNLFYNCGQFLFYGVWGGSYNLKQNTFANFNFNFSRQMPSVYFADNFIVDNQLKTVILQVTMHNNIIWGSLDDELAFDKKGNVELTLSLKNNLIKTKNTALGNDNFLNSDPLFKDAENENYTLLPGSAAINKGSDLSSDPYYGTFLSKDIAGKSRLFPSELGCYEN